MATRRRRLNIDSRQKKAMKIISRTDGGGVRVWGRISWPNGDPSDSVSGQPGQSGPRRICTDYF